MQSHHYQFYEIFLRFKPLESLLKKRNEKLRKPRYKGVSFPSKAHDESDKIPKGGDFDAYACDPLWQTCVSEPKKFEIGLIIAELLLNKLDLRPYLQGVAMPKLMQLLYNDYTKFPDWRNDIKACYEDLLDVEKLEKFVALSGKDQETIQREYDKRNKIKNMEEKPWPETKIDDNEKKDYHY